MSTRTRTLQTFEQFEQFQDDGMKHELLKGEHIVLPPPRHRHTNVQHGLLFLLSAYVKEHQLGSVRVESGFRLSSDTWLEPDVSFLRTAQIPANDPYHYYDGAPALAIKGRFRLEHTRPTRFEDAAVLRKRFRRSVDRLPKDRNGATALPGWNEQDSW